MEDFFKIFDENGKEKKYDVLAIFEYKTRNFIVYTDYEIDENNKANIYSSIYKKEGNRIKLEKIKEIDDIKVVEDFIEDLEKKIKIKM